MSILRDFSPAWLGVSLVRARFIETGTCAGDTLAEAVKQPFEQLDSIDIIATRVLAARDRFAADTRVAIHHGSSPRVLHHILRDVPTTFWLDAHYSGDPKTRGTLDPELGECPLLAELAAIMAFPWSTRPILVIDDASVFTGPFWHLPEVAAAGFTRAQWPTLEQIVAVLDGYTVREHEDILYAYHR